MKKKNKKVKNKKKSFLEKIFLEIKKIRVEDILFILLLITGILLILGFLAKKDLLSAYLIRVFPSPAYYFDLVVRNGVFKYVYFALVIALVYWLAKKIIKKRFNITTRVIVIIIGLVIAYLIYLLPPYYLEDYKPLPGGFWPYPTEDEINKIKHPGCGDRVDFLFSPSSELAMKVLPVIQLLIKEGIPVNIYCIGDRWINDDILCKKKYSLNPKEGEKLRDELGIKQIGNRDPQLVISCKYWIIAQHNITETRDFICNKTQLC